MKAPPSDKYERVGPSPTLRMVRDLIEERVLAINDGYRVKNVELGPRGIPFVRGGDIGDGTVSTAVADHIRPEFKHRVTSKLTKPGDVAFITKGTIGRVARIRDEQPPFVFAPQVCYWRSLDHQRLDPTYLFFSLRSSGFLAQLDAVKTHGSMVADYVSLTDQRLFRIPLPEIGSQRRIAEILGTLDDKIELNQRINETLEAMARALFQSWFIDFDPVHAKAAVRREHPNWTNAQVSRSALPNLDHTTAELFPDRFEESAIGRIPMDWSVARIDELATINGWTLGKNDRLDTIDYIEISEVMRGNIGAISRYTRGEEPSRARRRLRHGDVVLSTVRPDREAYFVCLHPSESLIASTGFAVLSADVAPWSWLASALTQPNVFEYLGHHADGGAYPAVNPTLIGALKYAVPTEKGLLEQFHSATAPLFEQSHLQRSEAITLARTLDCLMPNLLNGNIVGLNDK